MSNHSISISEFAGHSRNDDFVKSTKDTWTAIYAKSNQHFFLSWLWISTWLNQANCELTFLVATLNNEAIGCGFIAINTDKRLADGFFQYKYCLHRTGNTAKDQMWIEYNDFLLNKTNAHATREALVKHLLNDSFCKSLHIGITETATVDKICATEDFASLALSESTTYKKILNQADNSIENIIGAFSKNTKSQVRRSVKLLEQEQEMSVEIANTNAQALLWFGEAGAIHKTLWQETEFGSGFDNPHFVDFHTQLIAKASMNEQVIFARISHAGKTLGFIYGFIHDSHFYFYLSAFNKDQNPKIKVGLLAHIKLMAHLSQHGITQYDFLAGTARYKASLSDTQGKMGFYRITKNNLFYSIDNLMRSLKKSFQKK